MKYLNLITIALLFLLLPFQSFSGDLKKGWEAFSVNDLDASERYFLRAASGSADRSSAHVGLMLIADIRGEYIKKFEHLSQALEHAHDRSAMGHALRSHMGFSRSTWAINSDRIDLIESLIEDPQIHGTLKASLHSMLGRHYYTIGDFRNSSRAYGKVGAVREWSSVGIFENISGSGFDKDYEPIRQPKRTSGFTNKNGAPVNWERIRHAGEGVWINFGRRYSYSNSIVYAQTFCTSPDNRDVIINVGTAGTVKLWLNDELIFENNDETDNGMDTYSVKTRLSRGNNRILIQLGESSIANNMNFTLRVTDMDYTPMEDLSYDPFHKPYNKGQNIEAQTLPLFSETYFEEKIEQSPNELVNYILLTNIYVRNDKYHLAREIMDRALEIAPQCSYLLYQMIQIHSNEDNDTEMNMVVERLKKEDPDNPLALMVLFKESLQQEDYPEARSHLEALGQNYNNKIVYYEYLIDLSFKEGRQSELLEAIDLAYDEFPLVYTFVNYKVLVLKEVENNMRRARRVLSRYLRNVHSTSAMADLAGLYFQAGNASKGISILQERHEHDPSATGFITQLAEIYHGIGNYREAINQYEKALELAPYIGSFHAGIGHAYKEMGDDKKAMEAFEKCLTYNPYAYEERRVLRELQDEKSAFELLGKPDFHEIAKKANGITQSDYPEDNSVLILDQVQKVIYSSGANEEIRYLMVKVLNNSGMDSWKEYYLPSGYYSRVILEEAEVIKESGAIVKAERGGRQLVFTSLEVGDVVLIAFRRQNYSAGQLAQHFWDQFFLTSSLPAQNISYQLMVEDDLDFNHTVMNADMEPDIRWVENFRLYEWALDESESIKDESYRPSGVDVAQVLNFSSFKDWNYVAKWYYDLSESKIDVDYTVNKQMEELFPEGFEHLTQRQRAQTIYDYIVKDIRYSSVSFRQSSHIPQKASKTIITRIGDCKDVSTLFVTLAREAGLEAHIVLVNTRNNGRYDLALPSPEFNHAIAAVYIDQEKYYLDLTSDLYPFSSMGVLLRNSFALDIIGDPSQTVEAKYLNPETRIPNNKINYTKVTFENNNMTVDVTSNQIGTFAAYRRNTYRDIGEQARMREKSERLSSQFPNISLKTISFNEDIHQITDTVNYQYVFTVNNAITSVGNLSLFKIPFTDPEQPRPFASADTREHPLELWRFTVRDTNYEQLTITIPEGKRLAEVPDNISLDCEFASYHLTFKRNGRDLIVERTFHMKKDVVPSEKFEEFKTFYNAVVAADETQIGIR